MTREHIQTVLLDYIDRTVLQGQGSDLTPETALFDLGILDSFALFSVVGVIEQQFGVTLEIASLTEEDFHDVGRIAELVHSRRCRAEPV